MKIAQSSIRLLHKFSDNELVEDAVQDKLAASFARDKKLQAIAWGKSESDLALATPHGVLNIIREIGWHVVRNGKEVLIHARCSWQSHPAIFTHLEAAKAAALYHVCDGWGTAKVLEQLGLGGPPDGLYWKREPALTQPVDYDYVPSDLPDDYEWRDDKKLSSMIRSFGHTPAADTVRACENELRDCKVTVSEPAQRQLPVWANPAQGWHTLDSPRGKLVVRRLVGWTIERNGAPMEYVTFPGRLIFDRLEHAKIHALRHAEADNGIGDGTMWRENPTGAQVRAIN